MYIFTMRRQKGWWVALALALLLVLIGCADVKPFQPSNHREEGPQSGLFTGSQGEWVIYPSNKSAAEGEGKKKVETAASAGPSAPAGSK